jgi:hypothetical protein
MAGGTFSAPYDRNCLTEEVNSNSRFRGKALLERIAVVNRVLRKRAGLLVEVTKPREIFGLRQPGGVPGWHTSSFVSLKLQIALSLFVVRFALMPGLVSRFVVFPVVVFFEFSLFEVVAIV